MWSQLKEKLILPKIKLHSNANLLIALVANRPLAELAEYSPRKQCEPRPQAQEANLPLLNVLLDVHVHRKPLQFGFGHDRPDMYNLFQRERKPIVQVERFLPLVLVEGTFGPRVQR